MSCHGLRTTSNPGRSHRVVAATHPTIRNPPLVVPPPHPQVNNVLKQLYGQTAEQKAAMSNAALVGSVLGQLAFGLAGDALGRRFTFFCTAALIILGALLSATAT